MSFLFPLFLTGLVALSVPLILHLHNRKPTRVHTFPSLRFLLKKQYQSQKWRSINRLLVWLLRSLALLALILAFSWPQFFSSVEPSGQSLVIVLDTSASMQSEKNFAAAQEAALQRVSEAEEGAQIAVISLSATPRMLASFEDDRAAVLQGITTARPNFESTRPDKAVSLATRLLKESSSADLALAVISDFVGPTWLNGDWEALIPEQITAQPISVGEPVMNNIAVTDLVADQSIWHAGQVITVTATFRNFGADVRDISVDCSVPDEVAQNKKISVPGLGSKLVSFYFEAKASNPLQVTVTAETNDDFAADDQRYLVVPANQVFKVGRLARRGANDIFLETAFQPFAEAQQNRFSWNSVDFKKEEKLSESFDLLVIDQGVKMSEKASAEVQQFVEAGGWMLYLLNDAKRLQKWERDWLPLELGKVNRTSRLKEAQRFDQIDFQTPLLRLFSLPKSGNLFATRVFQWRSFTLANALPLIRLGNGDLALAQLSQGEGEVIAAAFPLEKGWTDWALQTTFLPFLHQFSAVLDDAQSSENDAYVGEAYRYLENADRPGFVLQEKPDNEVAASGDPEYVALNINPDESDLAQFTLLDALTQEAVALDADDSVAEANLIQQEDDTQLLILFLLLGGILFSIGELYLANRLAI